MSTRIVSGSRGSAGCSVSSWNTGFSPHLDIGRRNAANRRRGRCRIGSWCRFWSGCTPANYGVYGVRKMWWLLNREGHQVGRDRVARLMRAAGLRGVVRGRKVFTTRGDDRDQRPEDLVQRRFSAAAPNRLWVADLTYVRTWAGFCYVAFVVDVYSRMIVGWATSSTMRTEDLPLVALETAAWARVGSLDQLIHHSDRGSQGGFNRSSQHLDRGGADGATGGVDDDGDRAAGDALAGATARSAGE